MPAKGNNFFSPIGVAGPFEKALFARLPGGGWFVVAYGGAKILQSAKPVRIAAGGMLFCDEKWAKGFLGQDSGRLAAGRSLLQGLASTPRRRGVPFTRVRRRGARYMSGRYPYGIDNPPTLRRSSFPQRASRPAGGPIPKHTWGCAPRPPNAKLRLDTNDAKASSVRRRRYALKVPAAHFNFGPAGTELKINLISVV